MVIKKELELEQRIKELMKVVEVNLKSKGGKLLVSAIKKYYYNPEKYERNIYIILYQELAEEFGMSLSAVEKDIRVALGNAWTVGDPQPKYKLYGSIVDRDRAKATSAPFIMKSCEIIKKQIK